jgi:hypothetical protein
VRCSVLYRKVSGVVVSLTSSATLVGSTTPLGLPG